jgi:hypothetical protein
MAIARCKKATVWSVVVGNIGTVYEGEDSTTAIAFYCKYRDQSKEGWGKGAGEPVAILADGEIMHEYKPQHSLTLMRTIYVMVEYGYNSDPSEVRARAEALANERLQDWMLPFTDKSGNEVVGVRPDMDGGWEEVDHDV